MDRAARAMKAIYDLLLQQRAQGKKSLAVLIDPDKIEKLSELLSQAKLFPPDFFFVGGSLLSEGKLEKCIQQIRAYSSLPIILFPGNEMQISSTADALLLLSVISGRNPELLIGRHVAAAGIIHKSGLEIISTGYLLIESGAPTAVSYISNTQPIPRDKKSIAALTALAGEQLGMKLIYLEAGSGAMFPVPVEMIETVRKNITIPIITGGGIKTKSEIIERCRAGADVIVIGNVLEENPGLLKEFSGALNSLNKV
ncbi:MAG: geranylgeranylglyceryl/heptaprenylglyceryl phosphate synthase [Bacteroidetes bacterium]|nr:geranylgeranylglyceryl/heptaprenylglyceryl phosphate synthase [Bacteroidota bacterium]